ncbi:hypothetical protein TCAL_04658, partial [Tigriopus californicus]|eukprot:TCALIF_04658-PA protein Name:"Similar to Rad50 DNA repair protein RAD50 (Rattus norvegicus)" AED:0.00 eAED:0.06 QI:11/0/0/1/1/0.5/2/0/1199
MSYLESIRIQGIRSFGPKDSDFATMKFAQEKRNNKGETFVQVDPLTLILGNNGCGKTTIIEALRYATTGDFPPGSNGGRSFIHDPKMAGESVVHASVKLRFQSIQNNPHTINRAVNATQNPKTVSIKSVDSTIKDVKRDCSLSSKCNDVNELVKEHLGVSKAILNNVIFCHQEDSTWPLDEGSKVKDKFDEIFSAAKYQDCLKTMKDVQKKQLELARIDKTAVDFLREDRKVVREKRKNLRSKKQDIEDMGIDLVELQESKQPIRKKLQEMNEVEQNFKGINAKKTEAETKLREYQKLIQGLQSEMDYQSLDLSEDEIVLMISQLDQERKNKERDLSALEMERNEVEQVQEEEDRKCRVLAAQLGETEQKRKTWVENQNVLDQRAKRVREEFASFDLQSDLDTTAFMEKVVLELDRQRRKVNQESDKELEEHRLANGELEKQSAVLNDKKTTIQKSRTDFSKDLAEIKKTFRQMEHAPDDLKNIESTLEAKVMEVERHEASLEVAKTESTIEESKRELKHLETTESELRDEKEILDKNREEMMEIESKKKELAICDKELRRKETRNNRALSNIFDDEIPALKIIKSEFDRLYVINTKERQSLEADINSRKAEMSSLEKSETMIQSDVKNKEEKAKRLEDDIRQVLKDGEDLDEELQSTKDKLNETRHDLQVKEANKFSYGETIAKLEAMMAKGKTTSCPTCRRAFEEKIEAQELKDDLQKQIDKIPSKVRSIKDQLIQLDSRYEKLQKLHSIQEQRLELVGEIEKKKKEISDIQSEIRNHEQALYPSESDLDKLVLKIEEQNDLREDIFKMDSLYQDQQRLKRELADLEASNGDLRTARTLEEFKKEEERVLKRIKELRKEVEKQENALRNFHAKMNMLKAAINDLEKRKLEIEKQDQEASALRVKEKEIQEKLIQLKAEQQTIDEQLRNLRDDLNTQGQKYNRLLAEKEASVAKSTNALAKANQMKDQILGIVEQIQAYENSDNERKSDELKAKIKDLTRRREVKDKKLSELKTRMKEIQDLLMNQGNRKELSDNLTVKRHEEVVRIQEKEVEKFTNQLHILKYDDVSREQDKLTQRYTAIQAKIEHFNGKKAQMELETKDIERELKQDKWALAESKFREANIRMRCRQHAIQDLKKYTTALEISIGQYHKERMDVINEIIKELWRTTYKGNDIDYIKIQTDEPKESAGSTRRRNINY